MPLLLITGRPSSGKSTIAQRILNYFKECEVDGQVEEVILINDESNINFSRLVYQDFKKEKEGRASLRSAVQRLLNKNTIVICDSLNHIKGYRYELFCLAKNIETRYAVLFCDTSVNVCKWLNKQRSEELRYSEDVLSGLIKRYEQPEAKNRWDSPIFSVKIGYQMDQIFSEMDASPSSHSDELAQKIPLPFEALFACLVQKQELTANKCVKLTSFNKPCIPLTELDLEIQQILKKLIELQKTALPGDQLMVLDAERGEKNKVNFTKARTFSQLNRLRQQFTEYMRSHPVEDLSAVGVLFVDFLNSSSC